MIVTLNGVERELAEGISVAELIVGETGSARGSAVVLDDVVVPRGEWPTARLHDGQRVELITAVQGG